VRSRDPGAGRSWGAKATDTLVLGDTFV